MAKGASAGKKAGKVRPDPEEDFDDEAEIVEADEMEEEEEEEMEEGEEEYEEEERPSKKASVKARDRARKRKERARKKRNRLVAGVIVLILVLAILGAWIYMPEPDTIEVKVLNEDDEYDPVKGYEIIVSSTGGGLRGFTGDCTLTTSLDGVVTSTQKDTMEGGVAYMKLEMNKFVTGNGAYTITAKVGSKKASTTLQIKSVVEDIDFNLDARDFEHYDNNGFLERTGGKTNITGFFRLIRYTGTGSANTTVPAKPGQILSLEMTAPTGNTVKDPDINMSNKATYDYSYIATKAGEYDFKLTFVNTHIKSDSEYWSVVVERTIAINAKPYVYAGEDQRINAILYSDVTIEVDASDTFDDGSHLTYVWKFGEYESPDDPNYEEDIVTKVDDPTAEYVYKNVGAESFTVTLTVYDDGLPGVPNSEKAAYDDLIVTII